MNARVETDRMGDETMRVRPSRSCRRVWRVLTGLALLLLIAPVLYFGFIFMIMGMALWAFPAAFVISCALIVLASKILYT